MKNVELKQEGAILTVKIDLGKSFGPSASGKTVIIASTEGNVKVGKDSTGADVIMGLNIYKKP